MNKITQLESASGLFAHRSLLPARNLLLAPGAIGQRERSCNLQAARHSSRIFQPTPRALTRRRRGRAAAVGAGTLSVAVLVAALSRDLARPTLILTARSEQAYQWADTLRAWLPEPARVHLFADPDALPYERITWSRETRQQRLGTLVALTQTPRVAMRPANGRRSCSSPCPCSVDPTPT